MLALVLAKVLCLFVCLSHAGVVSKRLNESSSFWQMLPFLRCGKSNSIFPYLQNSGISFWYFFFQTMDLEKLRNGTSTVVCHKQATVIGLLLTTPGNDGGSGQVTVRPLSTVEYTSVASSPTNFFIDHCSCTLFTLWSVSSSALISRLEGLQSMRILLCCPLKPGAIGRVSYDSLTYSRLYGRDREKK